MKRGIVIIILGLICFLSSCMLFMREPEKHEDFMAHSDCLVYRDEVKTEKFDFGTVEFIDTNKAGGCPKEQLKNTYLLYYDSICVAVYNNHPKNNIKVIESFINTYQTDTTRLSAFVQFDSVIRITVDRLCKDANDIYYNGKYVWWRSVEYSTLTTPYSKTKDELLQTWYKWKE